MLHLLLASWFWHPLAEGHGSACSATDQSGCGYSFWSGGASDIAEVTIFVSIGAFVTAWYRKHNCHVHRCWRLQWHAHPQHGHPVCAVHHPSGHHGTWWRIFHRQPRPRDHFLSAHLHGYDHAKAPTVEQQFAAVSNSMTFSGVATGFTGAVEPVVGEVTAEPEPEKPKRVRKPGTEAVTDITSKKPPPKPENPVKPTRRERPDG